MPMFTHLTCWFSNNEIIVVLILYVTGSGKRYTITHIIKIELLAPRDRVSSQL